MILVLLYIQLNASRYREWSCCSASVGGGENTTRKVVRLTATSLWIVLGDGKPFLLLIPQLESCNVLWMNNFEVIHHHIHRPVDSHVYQKSLYKKVAVLIQHEDWMSPLCSGMVAWILLSRKCSRICATPYVLNYLLGETRFPFVQAVPLGF